MYRERGTGFIRIIKPTNAFSWAKHRGYES
jgi:hypothetical protein